MASHKFFLSRMVYSGSSLSYYARPDNWCASDHGSEQEKNQSLIVHHPDARCAESKQHTTNDASKEWMSGAGNQSFTVNLQELSQELCGFLMKYVSFLC